MYGIDDTREYVLWKSKDGTEAKWWSFGVIASGNAAALGPLTRQACIADVQTGTLSSRR